MLYDGKNEGFLVKTLFLNLYRSIKYKTDEAEEHLTNLGYFLIISFPVFYLINKFIVGTFGFDSLLLRLCIGFFGLLLVTRNYFPSKFKEIVPIILYFSLFCAFPFFFFFILFNNPESVIWKVNVLSGLFFLSFFLNWKEYVVFSVVGFFLAWFAFYLTSSGGRLPQDIIPLIFTYLNPIIYLAIFSRRKDNINQERLIAMKMLAGTIAHEMRTPFLGIRTNAGCLKKFLPILMDSYSKAKEGKLEVKPLSEKNLQHLRETPEDLDKITTSASLVIDMLLMSLKDDDYKSKNYEICSIRMCVEDMLREYPLSEKEKSLITWKKDPDFTFYGNTLFVKHVLFNLLKNALYYVKAANKDKGDISIWTEATPKENILYFKDTGTGMPATMVTHVFDRFYTHTHHGSGIGLSFCKSVMEGFGGSITCESKEGECTLFILKFPPIQERR